LVLLGSGADIKSGRVIQQASNEARQNTLHSISHILEVSDAFYTHPKVLITALNGPVIGLSAALIAHSDFIFAMPHVYLVAPFTSLGITAEGGSTVVFAQRMGFTVANEVLLMSKKIPCDRLVQCGFINEVFDTNKDTEKFLECVRQEIDAQLGKHLQGSSMLHIKALMRKPHNQLVASQTLAETLAVVGDLASASSGTLQRFQSDATGQPKRKNKL
jgi:Delta3-Delta2-enoyl-CoA isomerase